MVGQKEPVIQRAVRDESTKSIISCLIHETFGTTEPPPASGLLPGLSRSRQDRILAQRKYGLGGEGPDHLALKNWIANHPDALNLAKVTGTHIEHKFASGDQADVVFDMCENRYAAVEIETTDTLPGAHQAIKYRALLCAQKGIALGDPRVIAFLVGWEIPLEVREFCEYYGIEWKEIRVP